MPYCEWLGPDAVRADVLSSSTLTKLVDNLGIKPQATNLNPNPNPDPDPNPDPSPSPNPNPTLPLTLTMGRREGELGTALPQDTRELAAERRAFVALCGQQQQRASQLQVTSSRSSSSSSSGGSSSKVVLVQEKNLH